MTLPKLVEIGIVVMTLASSLFVSSAITTQRKIGFFIALMSQPLWVYNNYHYHQWWFMILNAWYIGMAYRGIRNNPL